ncbi:hypothetical protein EB1_05860 [Empedobacter brevis NBRC 14943 = ATCC 43319]|uniref:Uncharacterized protein n=1 Tax=Empedobacter brevis NBRC 14943 = ATCC 43319 TaxID=1218108 RepID=A0A511NDV3_9FLAO|nr:hypothetical protein EB1_05860 [Empedobacter brevis NBRC 14943 = ATCC 43319]
MFGTDGSVVKGLDKKSENKEPETDKNSDQQMVFYRRIYFYVSYKQGVNIEILHFKCQGVF